MVAGLGLEPRNPEGADLQSAAIATMRTRHVKLSLLLIVLFLCLRSVLVDLLSIPSLQIIYPADFPPAHHRCGAGLPRANGRAGRTVCRNCHYANPPCIYRYRRIYCMGVDGRSRKIRMGQATFLQNQSESTDDSIKISVFTVIKPSVCGVRGKSR